jgi:hypothetical protein
VGGREYLKADGKRGYVAFNAPGMADISGIIGPYGVTLEIEVKRPGEKATDDQTAWLNLIRHSGGIAFYADSLESCVVQLREAYERRGFLWQKRWEV